MECCTTKVFIVDVVYMGCTLTQPFDRILAPFIPMYVLPEVNHGSSFACAAAMMIRMPSEWGHGAIGWNMIFAPFATRQVFELQNMLRIFIPLFLQFWLAMCWCRLESSNPWCLIRQGRHVPFEPHPSGMLHKEKGLEWFRRHQYVGMSETGFPGPVATKHDE